MIVIYNYAKIQYKLGQMDKDDLSKLVLLGRLTEEEMNKIIEEVDR